MHTRHFAISIARQLLIVVPSVAALLCVPASGFASPILGSNLASFAVLGAAGVTNVPTSTIGGNLGSSPNPSSGGGYVFTSGSLQQNTFIAQQAQMELDTAILAVNAGLGTLIPNGDLDAYQALNGGFIAPGVYDVPDAVTANLTGNIFLNGQGSNTAVWRFRFSDKLITSTISNVTVTNVGDGNFVGLYWTVGAAATLNGPTFAGNVLAHDLISSDGNLTITCGRLLSAETQVTLIQDNISITGCTSNGYDQGGTATTPPAVPEPVSMVLLGSGLLITYRRRVSGV
jgi:hypothetical protein